MDKLSPLFETYGLLLVFGAVLLEQIGPPIPSGPLLIVAGALANEGRVSALSIGGVAWVACMLGKVALYVVGGHYGRQAMDALCRLAVTPNSSIGRTDRRFERWGAALLILAEFMPGVRTLAPTLAGAEKLSPNTVSALQRARRGAMDGALSGYRTRISQADRSGFNPCRAIRQSCNRADFGCNCHVLRRQVVETTKVGVGVGLRAFTQPSRGETTA